MSTSTDVTASGVHLSRPPLLPSKCPTRGVKIPHLGWSYVDFCTRVSHEPRRRLVKFVLLILGRTLFSPPRQKRHHRSLHPGREKEQLPRTQRTCPWSSAIIMIRRRRRRSCGGKSNIYTSLFSFPSYVAASTRQCINAEEPYRAPAANISISPRLPALFSSIKSAKSLPPSKSIPK
ncbi:hypothetical protein MPTK1_6g00280 [Marchantia polymorpha subsp. ruderalis]|uniref:Uncharacterized protein n=2 Tax=Marchantia polymorpha TaxID=3197 RepID=A0AAF6BM01_MARPO|nr:hypothetical protein MARPO_0104s0039 [Marchantia polymorpha]BBN13035.1 hypothetical protein Mp_6g00280 [Marchantia polymorpha subsp. ruderalis]|eukprot:PTQ32011.1 hypothetical protein MARPO_0104s0039 [Marchantia polymorpha]